MRSDRAFAVSAAIALLLIGAGVFLTYRYYDGQVHDPRRVGLPAATIDIPPGAGVAGAGDILARKGIIGSHLSWCPWVSSANWAKRRSACSLSPCDAARARDGMSR